MPSVIKLAVPAELLVLVRLAQLLQSLEGLGHAADPHQYQLLVTKLSAELSEHQGHEMLSGLLDHFPAAAEVYENLQYAHAGLCRVPLEVSLTSELTTRELLGRMKKAN